MATTLLPRTRTRPDRVLGPRSRRPEESWVTQEVAGDGRLVYRIPALDGIRAFAVMAVVAYHCGIPWMVGGYYGVDAFFVLSGFLITSLLVGEWDGTGTVALGGFWLRRARRLLPALALMLITVGAVAAFLPRVLPAPRLLSDTLASIFYVANWHLAMEHASYFTVSAQPSPLLHTWTLAIEEQFYLVWPVVVLGVMRLRYRAHADPLAVRRRRLSVLLGLSLVGAAASAAWMIVLAPSSGDPSRVYYGSDTRAQALLIGAALAIYVARRGPVRTEAGRRRAALVGIAGAVGVALLWSRVAYSSHIAFRGGFLFMALAAAAVVVAASQAPRSPVSRVLSLRPLRAMGRISYGMYLWYWPTLLVMTGQRTHLHGYALFGARLAVITLIAATSFVVLERPVQQGLLTGGRGLVATPLAAATATIMALLGTVPAGTALPAIRGAAAAELPQQVAPPIRPAAVRAPVRILFVGDSMSGSVAVGVSAVAAQYGAEVLNRGEPSCAPTMDQQVQIKGVLVSPKAPCVPGDPDAIIGQMRQWVQQYDPDVVVYLSRGELFDDEVGGHWQSVGQPDADAFISAQLDKTVAALSSGGAHVVLLTNPSYDSGETPNGSGWPEDNPQRVSADNALLRQVAAVNPDTTTVLDAGSLLSAGSPAADSAGVAVRCPDGIHVDPAGGEFLARKLLPDITDLGRAHADAPTSAQRATLGPQPLLPSWWPEIQC